jgi:hypothetical protein
MRDILQSAAGQTSTNNGLVSILIMGESLRFRVSWILLDEPCRCFRIPRRFELHRVLKEEKAFGIPGMEGSPEIRNHPRSRRTASADEEFL